LLGKQLIVPVYGSGKQLATHIFFPWNMDIFYYYVLATQDMHPLKPDEMVDHLKQGLGKEGQIFTYITF
jgi:hypothetical protein